jgi:1,4-alpha-glucan branching enzyme
MADRPWSLIGDIDLHLFNEGTHFRLHEKLGSHLVTAPLEPGGSPTDGVVFGVWAPSAERISVVGDFNGWTPDRHPLSPRGNSGVWEGFIPALAAGARYKYHIVSRNQGFTVEKSDPFCFRREVPPETASVVSGLAHDWRDARWMEQRRLRNSREAPMSIYEVHLGSWRRVPEEGNRSLTYRELAPLLAEHVLKLGFTHVEFMPVLEHPFYGSWGYEVTGYFSPTSRYGGPEDLMFLVDTLHQAGIGVIFDWVPAHFPGDEHGLVYFDGTHLLEHADPRQGFHPEWHSYIFNYGRHEVRSFLLSSAFFLLDVFHGDGLRVDGVASMLYLDYGRKQGEWIPNAYGGRENLEAVAFLKQLNETLYREEPGIQTIAEESTSWPMVSRPLYLGGLGFGMKWDMGWMHDTLQYFARDPVHRHFHHNELTFRAMYAFSESFVLPLSHDEVVYGKGSLLRKMAGDHWQKFASLRLLYALMSSTPGKKLIFMGGEFGQWNEWNHDSSLDWHLLQVTEHRQLMHLVGELNRIYREEKALHELDLEPGGFAWMDANDAEHSVLSYLRRGRNPDDLVLALLNFTPVPRYNYRVGVPRGGHWQEILNTDARELGGSGHGNMGGVEAVPLSFHGQPWSLSAVLPPLGAVFLKPPRAVGGP